MPTPFPASLSDRLTRGAWRDALPPHGTSLGKGRPFQVRAGSADGLGLRPMVETSQKVLMALTPTLTGDATTENGATVSLRDAHGFLDRLEAWLDRHGDHLTWPPSQHGWVDAVRATVDSNDQEGLATLLGAFPSHVRWAMKDHPGLSSDLGAWWKGQTTSLNPSPAVLPVNPSPLVLPPQGNTPLATPDMFKEALPASTPATDPVVRIPTADTVAHRVPVAATVEPEQNPGTPAGTGTGGDIARKPQVAPDAPEKTDKAVAYHDPRVDETVDWLKTLLNGLGPLDGQRTSVKQEWLDEKLKSRASQGKNWFEEQFFPAIARLNNDELGTLLKHWPNHRRFVVSNPVDMVSQARFWSILKAPEPVRSMLYEEALPRMLNMDKVSFDDRFTMAQHMLEWAKRNQDLFRQRLNLWSKWGGSVVEEEVLPTSIAPSGDDVFNAPPVVRRSVARWILEQGNEMWTAQLNDLAQQNRWTLPENVAPAVAEPVVESAPAPRRFRPR